MPTQTEVEYFRDKYQGFSEHKLKWSLIIGVTSGALTLPFELLKVRAQLLQEGRVIHGFSAFRGVPTFKMFYEIIDSGAGVRGLWKGLDTALVRSLYGSSMRTFIWSLFYNKLNKDPRSKYIFLLIIKELDIGLLIHYPMV